MAIFGSLGFVGLFILFFIYPFWLTITEIMALSKKTEDRNITNEVIRDMWIMFVAFFFTCLYFSFIKDIQFESDWFVTLINNHTFLWKLRKFLDQSRYWPILAFFFMIPVLGIVVGILMLFGQRPDSVIRMFTETADWNLSKQIAPPNASVDEHYLCTVAAGGHEKLVKPKRKGIRHGHEVIVNRQLCIANAFEQILEEKTPKFHRVVRNFYDKYGFPVAKLIRTKTGADVVYILMKPLEWIFLIVLYLTDVNPENRIAIQYTGKNLKDFGM